MTSTDSLLLLEKLNMRNNLLARNGDSGSVATLNLSRMARLQEADLRGTGLTKVQTATGAPLVKLMLPGTLEELFIEYLPKLPESGLALESIGNITGYRFAECPGIDGFALLERLHKAKENGSGKLERFRLKIDREDDGTLLEKYYGYKTYTATGTNDNTHSGLFGKIRLTKYLDEADLQRYKDKYPELEIGLPEYTMLEFDGDVSDDANVTNLDNNTGCRYGNNYEISGHIAAIFRKRYKVLAKLTRKPTSRKVNMAGQDVDVNNPDGEMTYYPLHDANSNYYADADNLNDCTVAKLNGTEGEWMMFEPFFWSKGINDYLNGKHYSCYSSKDKDDMPSVPEATVITLDDIKGTSGGYLPERKIMGGKTTLEDSYSTDKSYSVCKVDVKGYRRVRFPSVPGTNLVGSVFTDETGHIVSTVVVTTLGSRFEAGMYLISDIPEEAATLHFTILNTAEFDKVVLSNSDRIEDMEPDWVANDEHLCAVVGSSVVGSKLRACITGNSTAASMNWSDFHYYSQQRGMQQIDALMHSRIANLFYARYGRRDSQEQCGGGQHTNNRITGGTAAYGMQDTIGYEEAYAINNKITNSLIDGSVHQYAWYKGKDEYGRDTVTQVNNICCLGYEDIYGHKYDMMDGVDLPNNTGNQGKWRIWMPDGSTRMVQGKTASDQWICGVAHGKYMDMVPVGTMNGSSSTYYCDKYYISTAASRVVYRGGNNAFANGGVSYANAISDASNASTNVGSRLAFRGKIVMAESVAAYKAIVEIA